MLKERVLWESENGKYRVLVRLFDDGSIDVAHWKLVEGKKKDVRYRDLPEYIKDKIFELTDWIKHMGGK